MADFCNINLRIRWVIQYLCHHKHMHVPYWKMFYYEMVCTIFFFFLNGFFLPTHDSSDQSIHAQMMVDFEAYLVFFYFLHWYFIFWSGYTYISLHEIYNQIHLFVKCVLSNGYLYWISQSVFQPQSLNIYCLIYYEPEIFNFLLELKRLLW